MAPKGGGAGWFRLRGGEGGAGPDSDGIPLFWGPELEWGGGGGREPRIRRPWIGRRGGWFGEWEESPLPEGVPPAAGGRAGWTAADHTRPRRRQPHPRRRRDLNATVWDVSTDRSPPPENPLRVFLGGLMAEKGGEGIGNAPTSTRMFFCPFKGQE